MASCEVDKARQKPVVRLKKAKENPDRGREIQSGTICETEKAKLKQGERQMKPIRNKI
jgi:peptide subunit release factor 1 (eRF1)